MDELVTPRTKAIVVNTPSNPSGAAFSRSVVEDLVAFAQKHDLWLISDEAYDEFVYRGEQVSAAIFDQERVVSAYTFSKTYSMTGWRIGYLVAPPQLSRLLNKLIEPTIACSSSVSQKAAEAALKGPQDCVRHMRDSYRRRCDIAVDILKSYDLFVYEPCGAFYMLVDISRSGKRSFDFSRALLKETRVAVAPGFTFGPSGDNYVRVALCIGEEALTEGLQRICAFISAGSAGA
jgi:aspartate aminotransferase/aminotransferase